MRFIALTAVAVCLAAPAFAAEPSDWLKCDGLPKPEGAATMLGRGLLLGSTFGLLGMPEGVQEAPMSVGKTGVQACANVLSAPEVQNLWARQANLLRARAVHQVEAGDPAAAQQDLESAGLVAAGHGDDVVFGRSLGLSIDIFKAALLTKSGRYQEASAAALKAADARPYSVQVGVLAAVLIIDGEWTPTKDRMLTRLTALDPSMRRLRARLRDWGPVDLAADDWSALTELDARMAAEPRDYRVREPEPTSTPYVDLAQAALAEARAGRFEAARGHIATLKTRLTALQEDPAMTATKVDLKILRKRQEAAVAKQADPILALAELRLAVGEGRLDEARSKLESSSLLVHPATVEVLAAVRPDQFDVERTRSDLIRTRQQASASALNLAQFTSALPTLEKTEGHDSFSGQGGWGLKPNGFKDKASRDKLGRVIEFAGLTSSQAMVEEMMMRAAQLAVQSGKESFVVRSRHDYRSFTTVTFHGAPVGPSTPAGYRSDADVIFQDETAGAEPGLALNAREIWAALSPVYAAKAPLEGSAAKR